MAKRTTDKAQTDADAVIAYKAFEPDWTCRGFQYEVGKTYTHDGDIELCEAGFHACERAVDVLRYYPPTGHIAAVELGGVSPETDNDSKRVGRSITIKAAITIPMLVAASIKYTTKRCDPAKAAHSEGDRSASSATGDRSASSATGEQSVAAAFGYESKVRAGETGIIIVAWFDADADRKRVAVGYVGEDGIEADTWYRCDNAGTLVPA